MSTVPDVRTWRRTHYLRVRDFLYFSVLVFRDCVSSVVVSGLSAVETTTFKDTVT